MKKNIHNVIAIMTLVLSLFCCNQTQAQSSFNAVYSILNSSSCGSSDVSCHAAGSPNGLNFNTTEQGVYDQLYMTSPQNNIADGKSYKLVYPGDPYRSYLFRKINRNLASDVSLSAGEGDDMPPSVALSERDRELIRQWILYGAPIDGQVVNMSLIDEFYTNGGIETVLNPPLPPSPGEGFQLHLGPIFLPQLGESPEGGDYSRFDVALPDTMEAYRIETYAGDGVHHTTLFVFNDESRIDSVPYGVRALTPNFMGMEILATYQFAPDALHLPEGTAYQLPKNSPLIFNSHYFNGSQNAVLKCETYFNVYTQPKNTAAQTMKFGAHEYVSFSGQNPDLVIPPDGQEHTFQEHVFYPGNTDTVHIWAMIGHTHDKCTDYDIYKRNVDGNIGQQMVDLSCSQGIPDCSFPSYDNWHLPTRYFSQFQHIALKDGFFHQGTYVNNGTDTVFWGPSAFGQEMMVFGYYYVSDMEGVTEGTGGGGVGITDKESSRSGTSIFPNPFKDGFTISPSEGSTPISVKVFDLLGNLIYEVRSTGEDIYIPSTRIKQSGIYLLKIDSVDGIETHRICFIE